MTTVTTSTAPVRGTIRRPDDHVIVLFGATGDLAKRKLLPGLFHLAAAGLLPQNYRIIGSSPAKSAINTEEFRAHAKQAAEAVCTTKPTGQTWSAFSERLSFAAADPDDYGALQAEVERAEHEIGGSPRRLFHLAVPPAAFTSVVGMLGDIGTSDRPLQGHHREAVRYRPAVGD